MDRLIAPNSVPFANADTAPATGTPQYATEGNPVTNTPATIAPAYAWNAMQDEIMNVILGAGLTPNRNAWNQLLTAIQTMLQGSTTNVAVDTGAANAYVAAFTPALTAPVPWVPFWIKIAHANTGASTLNATGTVEPLVGGAHLPLQGGELVANGNALVYWNPTLASAAGSYVLMFCSGAPDQIAPATASQHAMQFGQSGSFWGAVSVSGNLTLTANAFGQIFQTVGGSAGGFTIALPPATGNIGKCVTIFNASTGNLTLSAGNFNTAFGSSTTSIALPPASTITLECDNVSYNGVGGAGQIGSDIRPHQISGVPGQVVTIAASNTYTLPAGGTWFYSFNIFTSSGGWASASTNIAAGGTNIFSTSSQTAAGFAQRIM